MLQKNQETETLPVFQSQEGKEVAIISFNPHNLSKIDENSFINKEASISLVTENIVVDTWQRAAEEEKLFFGYKEGVQLVEVIDETTKKRKVLEYVIAQGFFSTDGTMPKKTQPKLYLIGQVQAVRTLKTFPDKKPFFVRYKGAKMYGVKNIHQFDISALRDA